MPGKARRIAAIGGIYDGSLSGLSAGRSCGRRPPVLFGAGLGDELVTCVKQVLYKIRDKKGEPMKRSTGLSGRFQAAGLLAAVTCILLTASPASAATIGYTDVASFLAAMQPSSTENFDAFLPSTAQDTYPSALGFASYLVTTNPTDNIWISSFDPANLANQALSTYTPDVKLDFTFNAGIKAVGGNFFLTDAVGNVTAGLTDPNTGLVIPGQITVTLGDGTIQNLTTDPTAALPFIGFISDADILSLSVEISTVGLGLGNYATVDNLIVGVPTFVPEPQSIFLLLGGLTAGAWRLRRKKSSLRTE
jgi:hypothetical protein